MLEFSLDKYMEDPENPVQREKYAYRLLDGTVIKFSGFNPNRGELQTKGRVVYFMEVDVIEHAKGFYQYYKPIDTSVISKSVKNRSEGEIEEKLNSLVDISNKNPIYSGIVEEVIELDGVFNKSTPPALIGYTLASEQLNSNVLVWLFSKVFELDTRLAELDDGLTKMEHPVTLR